MVQCKNRGGLMPSPTTSRGLLRHFPCGADLPATDQRGPTPPIRLPTSSFLRAILVAGAGGRGARGVSSGCRSPSYGGGEVSGAGGRNTDREGATSNTTGVEKRTMVATNATAARACGRWSVMDKT